VLHYLLDNPERGMIYGANLGIERLFYAAKRSYFKQHKIENTKQSAFTEFKEFIFKYLIEQSIRGGNLRIFKSCLEYLGVTHREINEFFVLISSAAPTYVLDTLNVTDETKHNSSMCT
jgi:hypothetical protein